jgi:hypothetical protein
VSLIIRSAKTNVCRWLAAGEISTIRETIAIAMMKDPLPRVQLQQETVEQ